MVLWDFGGEAGGSLVSRTRYSVSFCYLSITPPTVCPSGSLTKKDAVLFFRHPYVFVFLGCCFLSLILVIDLGFFVFFFFLDFVSLVLLSVF